MGQPYVSQKFSTGEAFEYWIDQQQQEHFLLQVAIDKVESNVTKIVNGSTEVAKATNATNATNATKAMQDGNGEHIAETYAKKNGTYTNMSVGSATIATKALRDGNNENIADTYARKDGTYANMTVGNATNAGHSTTSSTSNKVARSLEIETSDGAAVAYDGSIAKKVGGVENPVNVACNIKAKWHNATAQNGSYKCDVGTNETGLYVASVYDVEAAVYYTGLIYIPDTSKDCYGDVITKIGASYGFFDGTQWLRLYYSSAQKKVIPVWTNSNNFAEQSKVTITNVTKVSFVQ